MTTIFFLIILIFSVIIHEVAHGSVANMLGDPTAKLAGRLTLNPLRHLDFFGSFLMPLFLMMLGSPILFAWAKPVPINPFNFKNQKWDGVKVALAGPAVNILIALVFGLMVRFFSLPLAWLTVFNTIIILNLVLAIFNLIPIPPLDGSHLIFALLPDRFNRLKLFLHRFGVVILFFFILFTSDWIFVGVGGLYRLITNIPLVF